QLAIEIVLCNLRPPMLPEIPSKIQDLIYRCWDADPSIRPSIGEIYNIVKDIYCEILENKELAIEYGKNRAIVTFNTNLQQENSYHSKIVNLKLNNSELHKKVSGTSGIIDFGQKYSELHKKVSGASGIIDFGQQYSDRYKKVSGTSGIIDFS
ncbi:222_t:CDS:2, partial [Cetraspora pellucida]